MTIVTRFAPSPTGYLHTGSARTALFNYLFSKRNGGKFLLRIEDTDFERSTPEATKQILDDMEWLGLGWDDTEIYQSKNIDRHKEVAYQLLERGNAYKCFSTHEEIEAFRAANPNGKFQSPWRDKNENEAPKDAKYVIRLKAPKEGSTVINDLIQGKIEVQNSELDDMVMLRSDGTPTYMLAVVVDDHDMKVTHIIRGDDHLTNAFRQTQIYLGMGWDIPLFGHIPLIHDKEGKKLSKRKGALGVFEYRTKGYLPEAVCNHLLRLGWSHGDDEIITMKLAIKWFDLEHIGKSPARFDIDKLNFINAHYIKTSDNNKLYSEILIFNPRVAKQKQRIIAGMDGLKNRASNLKDLAEFADIYIEKKSELDDKSKHALENGGHALLVKFLPILTKCNDWTRENLQKEGEAFIASEGIKPPQLMQTLRAGVLGTFAAPGIYEVLEILGKEETLKRLEF